MHDLAMQWMLIMPCDLRMSTTACRWHTMDLNMRFSSMVSLLQIAEQLRLLRMGSKLSGAGKDIEDLVRGPDPRIDLDGVHAHEGPTWICMVRANHWGHPYERLGALAWFS